MFRKTLAVMMVIVMLCMQFAMAEDTVVCACCGCTVTQEQQDEGDAGEAVALTAQEAYEEWFLTVYPLLNSCYADSTWITNNISRYIDGETVHFQVTYLLKEDALTFSQVELEAFANATDADKEDLYHMHEYIHVAPVTLATIRALKTTMVKKIPVEYEYVDSLIEQMMADMELLQTELVDHIKANGTMEGFNTAYGSTRSKIINAWKRIEWIYNFIK